ncbi:MAG: MmgE/PrpD family protein, partial [Solirubrobacteraceae bacterium]
MPAGAQAGERSEQGAPRSGWDDGRIAGGGTLLERLIALAEQSFEPQQARRAGGRALFDHLACLAGGRRAVPEWVGDAGAAAALDRDDVHWPSVSHPGAAIWSALRTVGAREETLWRSAHVGYEVTARLARALGPRHRRNWHATSTAGAVGVAAAAAIALGNDPVDAAAHAVSLAGGSIVCILERTGTRLVHRDHAAELGLRCARAAALGGARDGLEHPQGMFAAMGGDPAILLQPAEPALDTISFRRHATSGFCQALVEAAAELAPLSGPQPAIVHAPAATLALAAEPSPKDAEQAWWSCEHAVAATLLGRDLEDPKTVDDPAVARQRELIELQEDATSRVRVGARSGSRGWAP